MDRYELQVTFYQLTSVSPILSQGPSLQEMGEPISSIAKGQTFAFEPDEQLFLSFVGNKPRRTAKDPLFFVSIELKTFDANDGSIKVSVDDSADEEEGGMNVVTIGIIGGSILVVAVLILTIYLATRGKGG